MKKDTLLNTCWQNFVASHPELSQNGTNQFVSMMYQEKIIYARVAMDFTIKYMQDEEARTKK